MESEIFMKIAATYDNGNIFQHFGRTENFKIYEIEDGRVLSSQVVGTQGTGHEALADWLKAQDVSVIICGGIGGGAQAALNGAQITIIPGASGDCDQAVQAYLRGELTEGSANCSHHEHEQHQEEGCGGSCGHCGVRHEVIYEGKNAGKVVKVHYRGTLNDGTQFDSSYDRGQPLEFICGTGMMIKGFDLAVLEMNVGDVVNVHLMPEEAYGQYDERQVLRTKISDLPGSENLSVGQRVGLMDARGQQFPVTVTEKDDENITLDANHELAGKELNFKIELVEVNDRA